MDKKIVLAVAGAGKTTELLNKLNLSQKTLIITYTESNYMNIKNEIILKFKKVPDNIHIFKYFTFMYRECFLPFKANLDVNGIEFKPNLNRYLNDSKLDYFYSKDTKKIYHCRIAKFCHKNFFHHIRDRMEKYYDLLLIDEFQDFAGHDFNFIEKILTINLKICIYGDFYQHTFNTSNDGCVNKNLYNSYGKFIKRIEDLKLVEIDTNSLIKSKRCSENVCKFISDKLKINIESYFQKSTEVIEIFDNESIESIIENHKIIKLFYENNVKYNIFNKDNWGNSKGNTYTDVCVVLNKKTFKLYLENKLEELPQSTKNKLYVAFSRPTRNLYIINQELLKKYLK
ncbi:MAG: DNA helicase UvrD [Mycoplasmatota bacterium]